MRTLLAAVVLTAAACLLPATASAWTPGSDQCTNWKATHGGVDHPDCYVPPEQPPVQTPPEATPPPAPPVEVPAPPTAPPVDTPNITPPPELPKVPPVSIVEGKEQTTPESQPVQETDTVPVATGPTLPFSGLPLGGLVLAGMALGLTGFAAHRVLRS